MRNATLLILGALALTATASAQCTGTEGVDFERVTVRQINALPQESVDALNANRSTLSTGEIQELLESEYEDQTVEVTVVLLTDPYKSGVRSLNDAGIPNGIITFARDVAAATDGVEGQGILVQDLTGSGALQQFFPGEEIVVCGVVDSFLPSQGGRITQLNITSSAGSVTGTTNEYDLSDPIGQPVVITTDDIHDIVDGQTQIDWDVYADFSGQYVRFEDIEQIGREFNSGEGRVDVLLSTAGQDTQVNIYDVSVCFRNDRGADYFPPNQAPACIDEPFAPPPTGIVSVQGFLSYYGDDGGFNYSVPDPANFSIIPFEESDYEVAEGAPIITVETEGLPSPDGTLIRATVVPGTQGNTISSVVATYTTESGVDGEVTLSNTSGDIYEGTIEGLTAGDFLTFTVSATDNANLSAESIAQTLLVVDGPVSSIFQVQVTPDGGPGGSSITTSEPVAFDLDAVVQTAFFATVSSSDSGYFVSIQDDPDLGPFSGVEINFGSTDPGLVPGDQITITEARVVENFGVTRLTDVEYTVTGSGDPYGPKTVETSIFGTDGEGRAALEQHEGLLLRFEDGTIATPNADDPSNFGEFEITTDGGATTVRVDDSPEAIPTGFNDGLSAGQPFTAIEGLLTYSFGNYKLFPPTLESLQIDGIAREGDLETASVRILGSYPNPAGRTARVAFELATAADVSLRVFDAMGRQVAVVAAGARGAGAHAVTVDLGGLASGVYVLRLDAAGEVATSRIAVVR